MMTHRTAACAALVTAAALATHTAPHALAAQPVALPDSARPYLYFESFDEVRNPGPWENYAQQV